MSNNQSPPINPVVGQMWYDSPNCTAYVFNGTNWYNMGDVIAIPIENQKLTENDYDRAMKGI